jgi:hypothetical protein
VEDLEGEDGQPVDDESGRFGVERCGEVEGDGFEESAVDLLGEVVPPLVKAVDGVLDLGDGVVVGARVARFILAVPEVEVGLVLVEDELFEGGVWCRGGRCGVVAVERGLVVEAEDEGVEHVMLRARITEVRRGWKWWWDGGVVVRALC